MPCLLRNTLVNGQVRFEKYGLKRDLAGGSNSLRTCPPTSRIGAKKTLRYQEGVSESASVDSSWVSEVSWRSPCPDARRSRSSFGAWRRVRT